MGCEPGPAMVAQPSPVPFVGHLFDSSLQPRQPGGLGKANWGCLCIPRALSFPYKSWVFFFLFLACKIFHHLLCLGRMFAENISSSLIPIIPWGFGSLQAELAATHKGLPSSQAAGCPCARQARCHVAQKSHPPCLSAREGHWDLSTDGSKLT